MYGCCYPSYYTTHYLTFSVRRLLHFKFSIQKTKLHVVFCLGSCIGFASVSACLLL